MKFPTVEEIATRKVIYIHESAHVQEALDLMIERDVRDIVIEPRETGRFGIITINDIIRLRARSVDLGVTLAETGYRRLPHVKEGTSVLEILNHFSGDDDYLCVVNGEQMLAGIISYTDIITNVDPQAMIERQRVGEIVSRNALKTAATDAPLGEVLAQLANVGDAVILLEGRRPAGVITTKDAVRIIRSNVDLEAPANLHMTSPVETVSHDVSVREALAYVREKHFKRIIISDADGNLLGMIKQRELVDIAYSKWADMLRGQADELRELVELLENKAVRLERLAETDSLTGANNRAKFEQVLLEEVKRFNRYGNRAATLALMDLDHFKAINDTHGHLCGDQVLKNFVALVHDCIRDVDHFARWGGEEFVLLMPNTDGHGGQILAERIRSLVARHQFEGPGRVTVSIGIAEARRDEEMEHLVQRADEALYRAKANGRNRVELESGGEAAA